MLSKTLVGVALVVVIIAGSVLISKPKTEPESKATAPIATEPVPNQPKMVWSSYVANTADFQTEIGLPAIQELSIGPSQKVKVEVSLPNGETKVELKTPAGQPVPATQTKTENGKVVKVFEVADNKSSGDWQLTVTPPTDSEKVDYTVSVPIGAPPLEVSPTVSNQTTGETITVSITVQETTVTTVVPVTGANVVAVVTDPNQQTTTLVLTETNPTTSPGVYSGSLTGEQIPGTYTVEYTITGQNDAGEQFTQTTTSQFTVTTTGVTTTTSNKKYDINRSNQIRILGF